MAPHQKIGHILAVDRNIWPSRLKTRIYQRIARQPTEIHRPNRLPPYRCLQMRQGRALSNNTAASAHDSALVLQ